MVKYTQTICRQILDELFECLWPFCGIYLFSTVLVCFCVLLCNILCSNAWYFFSYSGFTQKEELSVFSNLLHGNAPFFVSPEKARKSLLGNKKPPKINRFFGFCPYRNINKFIVIYVKNAYYVP